MVKNSLFWPMAVILLSLSVLCSCADTAREPRPNILIILADDLGYGDLQCYNAQSLVPTPNLDRLAAEGIRLTDAYCPVSVCSPSRYALITGEYPFRSWKKRGVMANYEPSMMAQQQLTLPEMLRDAGYVTAGFGKWHLGATFATLDGEKPAGFGKFRADDNGANLDLDSPVADGPLDHGFDHWLGFSCASECWILDGKRVTAALGHDLYTIEAAPGHEDIEIIDLEDYLEYITQHTLQFVHHHLLERREQPFFIYYAPYVPHIPLAVSPSFRGTTDAGLYGDYVHALDHHIGVLINTMDSLGLTENTVVMFASDNGSQFEISGHALDMAASTNSPADVISEMPDGPWHRPNAPLRGTKWSIYEGGVRTPFIARWPGIFPAGAVSSRIFALNDLMPTIAAVIGIALPQGAAIDGYNQLPVLRGDTAGVRNAVVVQSSTGAMALRRGDWKYIPGRATGDAADAQLFNLATDREESMDRAKLRPDLVHSMDSILREIAAAPQASRQ